jgi:hypothetical protein
LDFLYNDGGRAAAGYKGKTGDCVTRAFAIATGKPYQEVYSALNALCAVERISKRKKKKSSSRTGVSMKINRKYLESLGWKWIPTMAIGTGCKVHLRPEELPAGTLIVRLSKHLMTVINHQIHDTYDPSRNGTRCVYGYWKMEIL